MTSVKYLVRHRKFVPLYVDLIKIERNCLSSTRSTKLIFDPWTVCEFSPMDGTREVRPHINV